MSLTDHGGGKRRTTIRRSPGLGEGNATTRCHQSYCWCGNRLAARARAQQPAKVAHIGYLSLGPASAWTSRVDALRVGLRDLGWIEGKNIVIEFRWADNVDQLPGLPVWEAQ